MALKKGYTAKFYRDTVSFATPTWNLIDQVKDIAVPFTKDQLDATTRSSGRLKEYEPGRGDFAITGKIRSDEDNADFTAFETAWLADSSLDIMILDGLASTNGSRGYRMPMKLFNFGEDQAEDGILYRDFELRPCICASGESKQSVVVSGGAPVYTDLTVQ